MAKNRMSAVEFVRLYNSCESVGEVAERMGCTENNVHQRRAKVAKLPGVTLRKFATSRGGNSLNSIAAELAAASKETLPEGSEVFVPGTRETAEVNG